MNESHHQRNQVIPIKLRPIPKINKIPLNNLNILKEKLKIDVSPYVTKNTKFQDLLAAGIQTHKNRDATPTRAFVSHKATRRHSIFEPEHTDCSTYSPTTHNTSTKSKESSRLPNIKHSTIPNQRPKNRGGVTLSVGNSFVFNNSDSDKEKEYPIKNYAPTQSPQNRQREKGKTTIEHQAKGNTDNSYNPEMDLRITQRRVSADARPVSRKRTISVDRPRDITITKEVQCDQEPESPATKRTLEQRIKAEESYMTLTSLYDSNKTLIDMRAGLEDEDVENSIEIIKGVVAKHVEATYKNINLIKKNFQRKSRTYMFYIPKNV